MRTSCACVSFVLTIRCLKEVYVLSRVLSLVFNNAASTTYKYSLEEHRLAVVSHDKVIKINKHNMNSYNHTTHTLSRLCNSATVKFVLARSSDYLMMYSGILLVTVVSNRGRIYRGGCRDSIATPWNLSLACEFNFARVCVSFLL